MIVKKFSGNSAVLVTLGFPKESCQIILENSVSYVPRDGMGT